MKKLVSLLIILATVLSLCACGSDSAVTNTSETSVATEASTEATESAVQAPVNSLPTPEQLYGHINQLEPVDGVYQVWSEVGVQNMADHPDATFKLLCNVDMKGATVRPIGTAEKPFTGKIAGGAFTISNFTVQGGEEESFGFISVNKGEIEKLLLKEVTFIPGANAKNVGSLVGDNYAEINRCTVSGTLDVSQTAQNANCGSLTGKNCANIINTIVEVDLNVTASGAVNVGGITGLSTGGSYEYTDTIGKLDVTGSGKSVGLFAGSTTDSVFTSCAFIGATNTVDGVLFENFTGNPDDDERVVAVGGLCRDNNYEPMPENVQKVREKAVQRMYEMGTIEWHVKKDLAHNCQCGTGGTCVGVYTPIYTYIGMPYKHGSASYSSFQYCLDEDGNMADWVYDTPDINGYDSYIGSMCSSASQMAWWAVSNSVDHMVCQYMLPDFPEYGCIPVGTGWYENVTPNSRYDTDAYVKSCSEQTYFEALAQALPGDCIVDGLEVGDHVRMVAERPVIVRDQDGNIDSHKSYLVTHEQGGHGLQINQEEMTFTTWCIGWHYSFDNLQGEGWLPVTIEELLTGEMEPVECTILDGADGKLGMTTGTVKANYYLENVRMEITDSKGQPVMDKIIFPKTSKYDRGNTRLSSLSYIDSCSMANFAMELQNVQFEKGETYSYKVTAHLATGDDLVIKEDSFVQGAAQ